MGWCQPLSRVSVLLAAALVLSGCATSSPDIIRQAHNQYISGNTQAAVETLAVSDAVSSKDQLLFLLEKGMYLHYAGEYEASVKALLQAVSFLDESDFISVQDETSALFANEWIGRYRGEYSERLWIHSVLMMNFLQLGQYESAAVEARQALEFISNKPDLLEQDHFTRALIAVSLEAAGQVNDSYIVNRKLDASLEEPLLYPLLVQQAKSLNFVQDVQELNKNISSSGVDISLGAQATGSQTTVILFVADGVIPHKFSGSIYAEDTYRVAFPQYLVAPNNPEPLEIRINNAPCSHCIAIHSDLGQLVSQSLRTRGAELTVKSLARVVAKDAIVDAIEEENALLAQFTKALLFLTEEADTRSWLSLPRHFTLMRIPLPAMGKVQEIELKTPTGKRLNIPLEPTERRFQFVSVATQDLRDNVVKTE